MRKGLLIVGLIILVLGAIMAFVPLVSQSVTVTGNASQSETYVWNNNGVFLPAMVKVSWTASTDSIFFVVTCTNTITQSQAQASNFNLTQSCNGMQSFGAKSVSYGGTTLHFDQGTSGSQTVTVAGGGTVLFGGADSSGGTTNINATASYPEPLLGLILLIVGILLTLLGAVMKKKQKPMPAAPQPWGAPGGAPGGSPPQGPPQAWQGGPPPGPWQQPPPQ